MTDPPMYNVASAVLWRSLAIVRSLPLPGCGECLFISSLPGKDSRTFVKSRNLSSDSTCILKAEPVALDTWYSINQFTNW